MADGSNYFSHDYNARQDGKVKNLLRRHGMLGYGIFWAIVEDLYTNANALQLDCEGIAFDLRCETSVVHSVIHDFGLFVINDDEISSNSVQKRIDMRKAKSFKASQSAKKRWNDANALQPQSDSNAKKIKKSKLNENKEYKLSQFDIFWNAYGKKIDMAKCKAKFIKLSDADIEKILATVDDYVKSKPDKQFMKNPLSYLNGQCWEDEIEMPKNSFQQYTPPKQPAPKNHFVVPIQINPDAQK